MANVLAKLFGDIAAAIREKTGDEGTMKPIEFPNEIRAIVTGGGDSGESGGGSSGGESGGSGSTDVREVWLSESGYFTPEEMTYTVEHHLGKMPDIVFLILDLASAGMEELNTSYIVMLFSTSDALLGEAVNVGSEKIGRTAIFRYNPKTKNFANTNSEQGIETFVSNYPVSQRPIYATSTTIKFGASFQELYPNVRYSWGAYAKRKLEGDSGDLMRYVTFIGANGQEIHKESVIVGDDCPNPVPSRISTPIKASTVSHTYTFSGWSLTDGGYASSEALKNVTTDRTVYAAFKESVRAYTVSFYDGNLLVKTEKVVYGGSSAYVYRKQGYIFNGWNPEPTNITGDISCYAQLTEAPAFAKLSWAEIAEISESGKASEAFNIGDEKTITLTWSDGTTEYVDLQIASFNNNYDYDTANPAKPVITLITKNLLSKTSKFSTDSSLYYWGESSTGYAKLYPFLTETVYSGLPEDLRAVMKREYQAYPDTHNHHQDGDDVAYIRPPHAQEVKKLNDSIAVEPAFPIFTDSASKIKLKKGSAYKWAMIGSCMAHMTENKICGISAEGVDTSYTSTNEFGVCFLVFI